MLSCTIASAITFDKFIRKRLKTVKTAVAAATTGVSQGSGRRRPRGACTAAAKMAGWPQLPLLAVNHFWRLDAFIRLELLAGIDSVSTSLVLAPVCLRSGVSVRRRGALRRHGPLLLLLRAQSRRVDVTSHPVAATTPKSTSS